MTTYMINGVKVDETTHISFVANPKRKGFQAFARYEVYQYATTIGELMEFNKTDFMPDARHDHKHGFMHIVD